MTIQCANESDLLNALWALDPFLDPWFWFGVEHPYIVDGVTHNHLRA